MQRVRHYPPIVHGKLILIPFTLQTDEDDEPRFGIPIVPPPNLRGSFANSGGQFGPGPVILDPQTAEQIPRVLVSHSYYETLVLLIPFSAQTSAELKAKAAELDAQQKWNQ